MKHNFRAEKVKRLRILGLSEDEISKIIKSGAIAYYCGLCGYPHVSTDREHGDEEDWLALETLGDFNEYKRGAGFLIIEEEERLFLL